MPEATRIFISYKRDKSVDQAERLERYLNSETTYDVWRDNQITTGAAWEETIGAHLLKSDLVIVLITEGTSESDWVKREVSLAKYYDISLLPLGHDIKDYHAMQEEVEALKIEGIQYGIYTDFLKSYDDFSRKEILNRLSKPIKEAKDNTFDKQQKGFLKTLVDNRKPPKAVATFNQKASSFSYGQGIHSCKVHVCAGDMAKATGIHVFINSENNYMQMARFFEDRRTISSILRKNGSRIKNGIWEDTIQQELSWQIQSKGRSTPVEAAEVFVTSAGGNESKLCRDNKARYIFHVAAVQAVYAENRITPYQQPEQIQDCVKNCFHEIKHIMNVKGVISPPGSDQYAEQIRRADMGEKCIQSIIFPIFGTGHGGKTVNDVIGYMIEAFHDFLNDSDNADVASELKDIYIAAYVDEDVNTVTQTLESHRAFERIK
jgi:O-acetyl-ADP-ribose deacetylase (regulator of RNase III)